MNWGRFVEIGCHKWFNEGTYEQELHPEAVAPQNTQLIN